MTMNKLAAVAAAALLALLLVPSADAQVESPKRGRLFLNGTLGLTTLDFAESWSFREFVEDASVDAGYSAEPGPGFEVGLQYRIVSRLGLRASFAVSEYDELASYSASLPHPLYFDSPREADGEIEALTLREQVAYVDLVVTGEAGPFDLAVFGGVALVEVEGHLLERIDYSHSYPYDTVTVDDVPTTVVEDSPVGFDAGVSVDYRLGRHLSLGAQLRFSRATAELSHPDRETIEVETGGLQAAAGVRFQF
jgi:opacity protein-like surface antigen